ncbi:MAG: DUF4062 domain-containing protein, partial [Planctomycetota bacterium]
MPATLVSYKVFIASPGGLEEERARFREVIRDYNDMDAKARGVHFDPVGWEYTLPGKRRPQALINEELEGCDYFVLLLWDRWGSPPDNDGRYTSGTEEEFAVATGCCDDELKPMREVVAYFKPVVDRQLSDAGPQLEKVLKFRKKLEKEKTLCYGVFDELAVFEKSLRRHLAQWVRDHEEGQLGKAVRPRPGPEVPPPGGGGDSLGPKAEPVEPSAPATTDMAEEAWRLADEGCLTEAEEKFAMATAASSDPESHRQYGRFLFRIGRLAQAEEMYRRAQRLAVAAGSRHGESRVLSHLGYLYQARGDFDRAEEVLRKALAIDEELGRKVGIAAGYANLGHVYKEQIDLVKAEEMYRKALAIDEGIGRKEGIAVS